MNAIEPRAEPLSGVSSHRVVPNKDLLWRRSRNQTTKVEYTLQECWTQPVLSVSHKAGKSRRECDYVMNDDTLTALQPVVEALGKTFGPSCEVVLHDLSNPESSVVCISNGHVTRRKVGSPATDVALRMLKNPPPGDALVNYETRTEDGRVLKSTTVLLRNRKGRVIGCLCVNIDLSKFLSIKTLLDEFCEVSGSDNNCEEKSSEEFAQTLNDVLIAIVRKAAGMLGVNPAAMSREQRIEFIKLVDEAGLFQIRGGVEFVAEQMGISRFTVYNYLKEARYKGTARRAPVKS